MIDLLAIPRDDGWAIVKWNDKRMLVRPPYLRSGMRELDEGECQRVLTMAGFEGAQGSFDAWEGLVRFLKGEMVRVADPQALESARAASRRMLERAGGGGAGASPGPGGARADRRGQDPGGAGVP